MRQGDSHTAQACLEQHLQLTQQLGDWQGEINAWSKMAQLATGAAGAAGRVGTGGAGQVGEGPPSSSEITEEGGAESGSGGGGNDPHRDGAGVADGVASGNSPSETGGEEARAAAGNEAVARALWCFERAAALAKAHDEASAPSLVHKPCTRSTRRRYNPTDVETTSGRIDDVLGVWRSYLRRHTSYLMRRHPVDYTPAESRRYTPKAEVVILDPPKLNWTNLSILPASKLLLRQADSDHPIPSCLPTACQASSSDPSSVAACFLLRAFCRVAPGKHLETAALRHGRCQGKCLHGRLLPLSEGFGPGVMEAHAGALSAFRDPEINTALKRVYID